jgi:hypothetical protein
LELLPLGRYRRRYELLLMLSLPGGIRQRQPPAPTAFGDALQRPPALEQTKSSVPITAAHLLRQDGSALSPFAGRPTISTMSF